MRFLSAPVFNPVTDRWDVNETDSTGKKIILKHDFASKNESDTFIKNILMDNSSDDDATVKPKKPQKSAKIIDEIKHASMLSDALSNIGGDLLDNIPENIGINDLKKEMEKKSLEWKSNWKKSKDAFIDKAKAMITGVAKIYFDARLIKQYEYVAYKQEIEAGTIGTMMHQITVAEDAICSLHEIINNGNALPRHHEVLAQMMKLVSELLKARDEYISKLEENYRNLRDELSMVEAMSSNPDDKDTKGKFALTSISSKVMIETVTKMSLELNQYMNLPSKNSRLVKDTDSIEDIQDAIYTSETEDASTPENMGLGTFDDDH